MYRILHRVLLLSSIFLGLSMLLWIVFISGRSLNKLFLYSKDRNHECDTNDRYQYFVVPKKSDINISSIVQRYNKYEITRILDKSTPMTYFEHLIISNLVPKHKTFKNKSESLIEDHVSNDSANDYQSYTFDDPTSYNGFEIDAWSPSKDRNVSKYINEQFSVLPHKSNFENKTLVIIVQSRPSEMDLRVMWRYFVGKYTNSCTSIIFLMGKEVDLGSKDRLLLSEERKKYNDIAMVEGLVEDFYNLTLKSLYSLKLFLNDAWFQKPPSYMLKVDIDVFVNIPKLFHEVIQNDYYKDLKPFVMGECYGCKLSKTNYRLYPSPFYNMLSEEYKQQIKSFPVSRWMVPSYLYNKETYPTYISGGAYLVSRRSAECMLQKASYIPYLTLEDVYVTGFLAQECDIKRLNHPGFTNHPVLPFDYENDIIYHLDYSNCRYSRNSMKRCSYDRLEAIESIMVEKKSIL